MNGHRLGSVLRIRHLQERAARGELAASRNVLRVAETAERTTWETLDERVANPAAAPEAASTALIATQMLVASGMLAAERQHVATVTAGEVVVHATEEWTLAARRVEGLERLVERQDIAAREEAVRRASNEVDDLVLIKFAAGAS